jgi:hypothetical protein
MLNHWMGDALTDWGGPAEDDERIASFDADIADRTIQMLNDRHSRLFLPGCGFLRPHTPLQAAQRWFDLHPPDPIRLPKTMPNDTDDLVVFGKPPRREQDIEAPGLFTVGLRRTRRAAQAGGGVAAAAS